MRLCFFVKSIIRFQRFSHTTMRALLLSLGRVTLLSRHQRYAFASVHNCLIPSNHTSLSSSFHHSLLSASSFSSPAHPNGDEKVAGPLVEYERRVVAGELLDGDLCQVSPPLSFSFSISSRINAEDCFFHLLQLGTLRELQRLYDELVQSADACRLDRYSATAKSTRFHIFFPFFFFWQFASIEQISFVMYLQE